MAEQSPLLLLIPGFGADHRLFRRQAQAFPQLVVPAWPTPEKHEPLHTYAARWGEQLRHEYGEQPICLGGVSMGGMIAQEMAPTLRPRCVMLISSCRSRFALDRGMRYFAAFTARLPLRWIGGLRERLPDSFHEKIGELIEEDDKLTRQMFKDTPTPFLRWGCHALATWRGCDSCDPIPCRHIHGTNDELILSSRVRPDEWIEGAAHAPTLTHAEAVNGFIERCMARCSM